MTPPLWRTRIRGCLLDASKGPLIMGIVNVTPDSFHDGGCHISPAKAAAHALRLAAEGAAILDIGGESTRPGSRPVTTREELRRVIPVIEKIRQKDSRTAVSIDTMKAEVARRALEAGADIVNDVSALEGDTGMAAICAAAGCPVVLMHRRGTSQEMYKLARYRNVSREVASELAKRVRYAVKDGIRRDRILVDPGIGFAKKAPDSWKLLLNLSPLSKLGLPILCGWSRKSFLRELAGDLPDARLAATLALIGPVMGQGVSVLRVHDVAATRAVLNVLQAVENP